MATIYYCQICEELIVDEDELPTVGDFCSRKCGKLFDKYGLEGGKKEFKKKGKDNEIHVVKNDPVGPVRNLPAESIPELTNKKSLKKKKSNVVDDDKNVVFKNNNSFFTFIGKKKSKSDISKQKDYDDSLEYFRKQSEIEHSMRDVLDNSTGNKPDNTINEHKEQLNRPPPSHVSDNHGVETPPPRERIATPPPPRERIATPPPPRERIATPPPPPRERIATPPPPPRERIVTPPPPPRERIATPPPPLHEEENQPTTQSLYPDIKPNRPPIEDFENLDINEPPPSYDALYPDPPPQPVKVEKPLSIQPTEKKPIVTDQKKPIVTDQKKPIVTDQKKPIVTDKKEPNNNAVPPLLPPKVPPKVSIPTAKKDITPPQPQTHPYPNQFTPNNFSPDSNSYQQFYQFQQFQFQQQFQQQQFQQNPHFQQNPYFQQNPHFQQYQHYQQSQGNTPNDTFIKEQESLPSTVYPPPFYTTRFNKNNGA